MNLSHNAQVLDALVRMVVPMRREFGYALDVQAFMHDAAYAHQVLGRALTSQVDRLRQYAEIVHRTMAASEAQTRPNIARAAPVTLARAAAAAPGLDARRRVAAKRLLDLVGPLAQPLCIKLQRAASAEDFASWLALAQQCVAHQRGVQAGRDFLADLADLADLATPVGSQPAGC